MFAIALGSSCHTGMSEVVSGRGQPTTKLALTAYPDAPGSGSISGESGSGSPAGVGAGRPRSESPNGPQDEDGAAGKDVAELMEMTPKWI